MKSAVIIILLLLILVAVAGPQVSNEYKKKRAIAEAVEAVGAFTKSDIEVIREKLPLPPPVTFSCEKAVGGSNDKYLDLRRRAQESLIEAERLAGPLHPEVRRLQADFQRAESDAELKRIDCIYR